MTAVLPPSALGLLVNESRARCPELSGDFYSRLWLSPRRQQNVSDLWQEFASTVCPQDHIALSIRTRYFRSVISAFFADNAGSFLNVAGGLTSYAFDLPDAVSCFDLDSADIMDYKTSRTAELVRIGDLPDRSVNMVKYDMSFSPVEELQEIVSRAQRPRLVLLEGISYYLESNRWAETLFRLKSACQGGDVICFDFWKPAEGDGGTLKRYEAFLKRHECFPKSGFNFLDPFLEGPEGRWDAPEVTSVFEQHKLIGREWEGESEPPFFVEHYCVLRAR